ncbi:hypothetical protein HF072_21475 [Bacillus sp. RO3]|nr:hypothetical protein [Bacillus sp. RO3]
MYHVTISDSTRECGSSYQTGFSVSYSNEYSNPITAGNSRSNRRKEVFRELEAKTFSEQSIRSILMIIGFLFFFFEIAERRFGLSLIMSVIQS